ncbi:GNAT family N-acetyltransferase [Nocardioides bizhenqiangii]|uniref:GNAT family N-acetyltransferase n=1 Tax=Nocardioides bizhenqiangii TaxID=3095076 RepID=A0ABZ0ZVW0_9ACTN|nr:MULTISPECIES: GNAT family N-acetyltransferase [unclassified Nocardioides]MDZ5621920.1 GNAT family N-acetyltransferase [Nocardioides sp. HM23]WQQ27398.1 GNAT family N-acetyltransferase [Nocardioides sp. HM61]
MTDTPVTNNIERKRFEIHVEDGRLAGFAEYVGRDGVREFVHTVVKDQFEGQGIGGKLARAALDQTRADGLKVVATCPFIKGWIGKHPDYEGLLV